MAHGRHDLFTFCMCAGGYIMPSVSEPGYFCTNGMSLSKHDSPFANSGLVVTIAAGGVRRRRRAGRRALAAASTSGGRSRSAAASTCCPIQRATDFLADRPTRGVPANSYPRGAVSARIARAGAAAGASTRCGTGCRSWTGAGTGGFCRRRRWSARSRAAAPRCASSATTTTRETPGIEGLYPVGEGAGYAGGIVSAAVDGLRSAKAIVAKYAPLEMT